MKNTRDIYNLWVDGSYRSTKDHGIGAGWVLKHQDIVTEHQAAARGLEKEGRLHGSFVAEIYAVNCALSAIPEGSNVLLRLDAENAIKVLNEGKLSPALQRIEPLQSVFAKAMQFKDALGRLEIVKVSDRNNEFLQKAHQLAQASAGKRDMDAFDIQIFALASW